MISQTKQTSIQQQRQPGGQLQPSSNRVKITGLSTIDWVVDKTMKMGKNYISKVKTFYRPLANKYINFYGGIYKGSIVEKYISNFKTFYGLNRGVNQCYGFRVRVSRTGKLFLL